MDFVFQALPWADTTFGIVPLAFFGSIGGDLAGRNL